MGKRRPSGDGHIGKRVDGRWEARIVAGHKKNGLPIFKSVACKTQREARVKLDELKEMYRGVELTEDSRMTLGEWLDKWLIEYKAPPVLRQNTYNGYERDINHHIKPYIGDKVIMQVKSSDVQKLINKLKKDGRKNKDVEGEKGLASATVRGIHSLLHAAMESAVLEGIIPSNPCIGTTLPKLVRKEKTIVGIEQMQKLMELLREDEIWHEFFMTDFLTGMRRGEICGLRWEDFDNERGTLTVNRTVTYVNGKPVISPPKTEEGNRTFCLPDTLWWILSDRKEASVSEWIFHDPVKPELPIRPNAAYHRLHILLKQAGLERMRFHDIRHSFASVSANIGVAPQVLSSIVGHTKASFTLDTYAHVTTSMQRGAAKIVENYITDIFGKELKPWQNQDEGKPVKARFADAVTDGGKAES